MFTTLITFFLTFLGALRATPLYSGILTLGNGLQSYVWIPTPAMIPLLASRTAHPILHTPTLRLPFLPAPSIYRAPSISATPWISASPPTTQTIIRAVLRPRGSSIICAILWFLAVVVFYHLACELVLALKPDTIIAPTKPDPNMRGLNIYLLGVPYDGVDYECAEKLAGAAGSLTGETPSMSLAPAPLAEVPLLVREVPGHGHAGGKPLEPSACHPATTTCKVPGSNPTGLPAQGRRTPGSPTTHPTATRRFPISERVVDGDHGEVVWHTWTKKRRKRPPRQPSPSRSSTAPPPHTLPSHSLSSSHSHHPHIPVRIVSYSITDSLY
ncbi:hypothetical protein C8Q77DRAFT_1071643 [Trametes polyzona]|nr:hypothetical protein C8Q77DRAFT_1071643 [Trametes polyzona]